MNKGLYIHFPFCESKCNYCDFYSVADSRKMSEYVDALCREISSFAGIEIDTVYFGGGTPSLMSKENIKKVLNTVFNTFSVAENAEITLEANPMTLSDSSRLTDIKNAGINRLSIGVQSFSDSELRSLGRRHSAREAVETVKTAKQIFDNVSLDLMFAIPHQTADSFCATLGTALSLSPDHISLYALSVEEKTVFGMKQRRGEDLFLPSEDSEAEMYFSACKALGEAGYEHYEISNFALDGKRSRHNMKYWRGEEYIGVGASAHSYYMGERYSLPPSISEYLKGTDRLDCYTNTPRDRAEEFIFLSLRLKDGLDLEMLKKEHGMIIPSDLKERLSPLLSNGLCRLNEKILSLTEKGFFVSNSVIVEIFDALDMN